MSARRAGIALVVVVGLAALATGAAVWALRARPTVIVVERGDTLFELAGDHGVSVDDLRGWNDLEGDLIEVGQVLLVWPARTGRSGVDAVAAPKPLPARLPGKRPSPAPQGVALTMPAAKPCLAEPTLEGTSEEVEMVGSVGLSEVQVRQAMGGFVHHTLRCLEGTGASPAEALRMEIRVACTGRVDSVEVLDSGDWTREISTCVTDTLGYAPFPAHDLPGGDVFEYPLRYRAE